MLGLVVPVATTRAELPPGELRGSLSDWRRAASSEAPAGFWTSTYAHVSPRSYTPFSHPPSRDCPRSPLTSRSGDHQVALSSMYTNFWRFLRQRDEPTSTSVSKRRLVSPEAPRIVLRGARRAQGSASSSSGESDAAGRPFVGADASPSTDSSGSESMVAPPPSTLPVPANVVQDAQDIEDQPSPMESFTPLSDVFGDTTNTALSSPTPRATAQLPGYTPTTNTTAPLLEEIALPSPTPTPPAASSVAARPGTITTLLFGMGVGGAMVFAFLAFLACVATKKRRRRPNATRTRHSESPHGYSGLASAEQARTSQPGHVRTSQRMVSEL